MQSSQTQTANLSQCRKESRTVARLTCKGLARFLASIIGLRPRYEDDIVARYAGCGWNDAVERQMVDDIATMRCTRQ
jgi:hypothetical protein